MKLSIGGAARLAAIAEVYDKALRSWSELPHEVQQCPEGEELKRRLEAAGANLQVLEQLVASEAVPIVPRRQIATPWQPELPALH